MTSGIDIWPSWLKRIFPTLQRKGKRRRDCCDYELPPPRLVPDRLPITRPSSPCSPPAPEPKLNSHVPSLESQSVPRVESQSPLLEALPLEIRQEIWSLVLGRRTLHLVVLEDRLGCYHCQSADPSTCGGYLMWVLPTCVIDEKGDCRPPLPEEMGMLLPLLTTCRQVYTEAIEILYSSNTFTISNAATMEYLPLSLLPKRLNTIRTLRLSFDFSGPPPMNLDFYWSPCGQETAMLLSKRLQKWQNIWRITAAMTGLRQLDVYLRVDYEWEALNQQSAAELLGPVKQVTRPDIFVLTVPFPAMYEGIPRSSRPMPWMAKNGWEGSDPWDDLPNCKIRRV